ncbi:hypothetical protein [Bacillus sp. AK128]
MKVFRVLFVGIILSVIMPSCSKQENLTNFNKVNVEIVTDVSVSGKINVDDKKGRYVTPTSLYYNFTIQKPNLMTSKQFHELFNQYEFIVEPSAELKKILQENVGRNIFDLEKNKAGANVDYMAQRNMTYKDNEIDFSIAYSLGVKEQNPLVPMLPNDKVLKLIEQNAFESSLVFKSEDGEEVRHNLSEFK